MRFTKSQVWYSCFGEEPGLAWFIWGWFSSALRFGLVVSIHQQCRERTSYIESDEERGCIEEGLVSKTNRDNGKVK